MSRPTGDTNLEHTHNYAEERLEKELDAANKKAKEFFESMKRAMHERNEWKDRADLANGELSNLRSIRMADKMDFIYYYLPKLSDIPYQPSLLGQMYDERIAPLLEAKRKLEDSFATLDEMRLKLQKMNETLGKERAELALENFKLGEELNKRDRQ